MLPQPPDWGRDGQGKKQDRVRGGVWGEGSLLPWIPEYCRVHPIHPDTRCCWSCQVKLWTVTGITISKKQDTCSLSVYQVEEAQ